MMLMMLAPLSSCSSDDNDEPNVGPENEKSYHFDLWVALDRHGGMGRDVQTLVRSINSLDADQPEITFQGTGTEVNAIMSLETILKGAYYYQVPVSGDRFSKYVIKDNEIQVVKEQVFKTNTYNTRKYTHAWLDDSTLVIVAANGDGDKIIWTKLNTDNMSIISEGTLDIPMPEGAEIFTTSGLLTYRHSDRHLFYFYYAKTSGRRGKRVTPMMTAVVNPETMAVEQNYPCFMDCEMVGTAFGELLQTTTIIDEANNLYIATVTGENGSEEGHLLKIPAGKTDFDPSYDGFSHQGKLISILYVGEGKALVYTRDDRLGINVDDFSHYYGVLDVASKKFTPLAYEGEQLPMSSGRFSSRMAYADGNAYIGVDAEGQQPQIYIYNVKNGTLSKGATIAPGYYFEQIRVVENLP